MAWRFESYVQAGQRLACQLIPYRDHAMVVAAGVEGAPVACETARFLAAPLGVMPVVALAGLDGCLFGAMASGGAAVVDWAHYEQVGEKCAHEAVARAQVELERLERAFAGYTRVPSGLRHLILVAGRFHTGLAVRAALRAVKRYHPVSIVPAAPVVSAAAERILRDEGCNCVSVVNCLTSEAAGDWYRQRASFREADVLAMLDRYAAVAPAPATIVEAGNERELATDTTGNKSVFAARGITKVYHMGEVEVHALRGVDLDLFSGEMMVLLGPSGSGKSTLLNILGGLDRASAGTVTYRDFDLTRAGDRELTQYRRRHVGFVFQFYNLIPSLTALENVAAVTEIADNPMKPEEALELVGLGDRMHHFPSQLSGGQQQRVAIARAIAKRPSVLLCDEPTGALDSETGVVVLEAIDKVNRELGAATAVITHNADIAGMADRVVHMTNGHVADVTRNEARRNPRDLHW